MPDPLQNLHFAEELVDLVLGAYGSGFKRDVEAIQPLPVLWLLVVWGVNLDLLEGNQEVLSAQLLNQQIDILLLESFRFDRSICGGRQHAFILVDHELHETVVFVLFRLLVC